MNTKLKNKSVSSNSPCCQACGIEERINQLRADNDLMEALIWRIKHEHVSMSDHLMIALKDPIVYHSLNFLFETSLHHYHCFNNAFQYLPFDEMAGHKDTPLVDVVRVFSEIKDSLLSAHLNTAKSNV